MILVVRADSHPTLSMLVACSVTGNCIFIDVTSLPKVFNCFHLYDDVLDRIKISHCGEFLGTGSSQTGKLFIIGKRFKQQPVDVLGFIEIGGYVR